MNKAALKLIDIYNEMVDSGLTPMALIDVDDNPSLNVPLQYVNGGYITLMFPPKSVRYFQVEDDGMSFLTRFSGIETNIFVPLENIIMVYSQEKDKEGNYLLFGELPDVESEGSEFATPVVKPSSPLKPALKVISGGKAEKPEVKRPQIKVLK